MKGVSPPLFLFYFQRRDAKYARERGRNEVTHRCHVCRLAFRISEENTSHDWLVIFFWGSSLTISITTIIATRGSAVGWGTALQAGRSWVRFTMVSLEFFTDALWPWGWLRLTEMSIRNISWGGKGGRCVELTILPSSCADCLEIWEPQPPGTLRACPGP